MQLILLGPLNKIKNNCAILCTGFYVCYHIIFAQHLFLKNGQFSLFYREGKKSSEVQLAQNDTMKRPELGCRAGSSDSETTHLTNSTSRSSLRELQARPALLGGVSAPTPGNQEWLARKQRKRRKTLPSFLSQEFSGLLLFGLTTTTRILARSNMTSHIYSEQCQGCARDLPQLTR